MPEISISLTLASFTAGIIMFLAPCTLPLVPAYLAYISGIKSSEKKSNLAKVRLNAIAYTLGFSTIFIAFGMAAGSVGSLLDQYRGLLSQIGGAFIILFALMMLNVVKIGFLSRASKVRSVSNSKVGHPFNSYLIGAIFAISWTPCVGPILASVLLLAAGTTTVFGGAFLLAVFSLGFSMPFILVAILYAKIATRINFLTAISDKVSLIGGVFLLVVGILMVTSNFLILTEVGYQIFGWLGLEGLYNYF